MEFKSAGDSRRPSSSCPRDVPAESMGATVLIHQRRSVTGLGVVQGPGRQINLPEICQGRRQAGTSACRRQPLAYKGVELQMGGTRPLKTAGKEIREACGEGEGGRNKLMNLVLILLGTHKKSKQLAQYELSNKNVRRKTSPSNEGRGLQRTPKPVTEATPVRTLELLLTHPLDLSLNVTPSEEHSQGSITALPTPHPPNPDRHSQHTVLYPAHRRSVNLC